MAIKTLLVAALSLATQCNTLTLQSRKQDPSVPVRWSENAPVDAIPDEFSVSFSTKIPEQGGWDTKRYFTNSIEWILELAAQDFNGETGAIQLYDEGATFNLKAQPVSNSTFPRRHLIWALYRGLEYRLKTSDWRPGSFDLKWENQTTGILEFVDIPNPSAAGANNNHSDAVNSDYLNFRAETTWLSKAIIDDNDLFLAIARMALSTAIFGLDNIVSSPLGWSHSIEVPSNRTSGKEDKVQISVVEPPHPGGELKLEWGWVAYLLRQALDAQSSRHYSSDLQVKLFNTTATGAPQADTLLGTLKVVSLELATKGVTPLGPGDAGSDSGHVTVTT